MQKSSPVPPSLPRAVLWLLAFAGIVVSASAQTTFIKADNTNALNTAASYTCLLYTSPSPRD